MTELHILTMAITGVVLFLFGLDNFSKEIQKIAGEKFRKILARFTQKPIFGILLGGLVTSVIQSSSATSIITIGLVNAGIISFKNSLGIIFGANIGTTITAQLVAFKLTNFAPAFIILGFILSILKNKLSLFGKSIFYFGFVFFTLNIISSSVIPLQEDQRFIAFLTTSQSTFTTITLGALFTALVQSSSVTTGLAVIFTQNNLLSLENAIPIIMGANIGTTATALLAMFNMDSAAKKTALSHFLFNFLGVLIFIPFIKLISSQFNDVSPEIALATIHLLFNIINSMIFLSLIKYFEKIISYMIPDDHHLDFPIYKFPEFDGDKDQHLEFIEQSFFQLYRFLKESYNLVTLSLETNYKNIYENVKKRESYFAYTQKEFSNYFSKIFTHMKETQDSKTILEWFNQYEYLFQINDSLKDLIKTKEHFSEAYIELQTDFILHIREISTTTLNLFSVIEKMILEKSEREIIRSELDELQNQINNALSDLFKVNMDLKRVDSGTMTYFLTYSQRLRDKLSHISKHPPKLKSRGGS